jgi:hypothetical protein
MFAVKFSKIGPGQAGFDKFEEALAQGELVFPIGIILYRCTCIQERKRSRAEFFYRGLHGWTRIRMGGVGTRKTLKT